MADSPNILAHFYESKLMEHKQNKPKLSTRHLSFSEKLNKKIAGLKEIC